MVESLPETNDAFGKTTEYFPQNGTMRVSIHERPKDSNSAATIIVPGWTGTPDAYAPVFDTVFEAGRNTVAFTYPENQPDLDFTPEEIQRMDTLPREMRRKAVALLGAIETTRKTDHRLDTKTDIFAHSEGFAVAVLAAHIRPSQFRDVVGYGPIGVAKSENWLRLLAGFAGQKFEKHDWGPEPTVLRELAREYAEEKRDDIRKDWLTKGGNESNERDFEKFFETYTEMLESDLAARKQDAERRGITEFVPPTKEEHQEAARRRQISDSTFFRHIKGRPWRSFLEAKEFPSLRLAEIMRDLSDQHGIGFAIAVSGDDSVMNRWRKNLKIINDILAIKKQKPRIHNFLNADGHEAQRTVFDPVVKTLTLPGGGHQGVVGYPSTTREVERALTHLNRERI